MKGDLSELILKGNTRAAARLMRLVDDGAPRAREELARLFPHTGQAFVLGVTGNPGAGKSTLVSRLIAKFRENGQTVGCVAVDPTSPFSGGAILGDRVRMQTHADDPGVFIRSVATRGHLGGLSRSTPAMVQVMDAMGFDVVIIETVGVGQAEVEIVQFADVNLVLLVPGLGDDIQAEKAGLMEIADIFVLNKADRPGIQRLHREVRTMLNLYRASLNGEAVPRPDLIQTSATEDTGLDELFEAISTRRRQAENSADQAQLRRRRYAHLMRAILRTELESRLKNLASSPQFQETIALVAAGQLDPYSGADELLHALFHKFISPSEQPGQG